MTDTLPLPHDAARNSNAAPKPRQVDGLSGRHEDLHEMIAFEDPSEQRTWMIDATFMRSSWKCIFGEGCQGVYDHPAPELNQGCCSHGAHFVDEADVANVVKHVVRLTDEQWQMKPKAAKKGFLKKHKNGDTTTRRVDGACIFLNRPGFEGGAGCAFHIAAMEAGERPLDWKPNVCWQLPIRLEHHTDTSGWVTTFVREWKRRDWGNDGDDLHWWCTDTPDAFVGKEPVYKYLKDEMIETVGRTVYDLMVEVLERPNAVPLPHPVMVKRKKKN
ncbi:MAG: hypothetical protein RL726_1007 [Actinomycetota bacterium]